MTGNTNDIAKAAFNAAWACAHTIDDDSVKLFHDPKKPGHNALNQLHLRIEAAVSEALARTDSAPVSATSEARRTAVRDAIAESLTSVYVCTRVWEAWGVGTMSRDDFEPAGECDEVVDGLTDAALSALSAPPQSTRPAEAASEARVDALRLLNAWSVTTRNSGIRVDQGLAERAFNAIRPFLAAEAPQEAAHDFTDPEAHPEYHNPIQTCRTCGVIRSKVGADYHYYGKEHMGTGHDRCPASFAACGTSPAIAQEAAQGQALPKLPKLIERLKHAHAQAKLARDMIVGFSKDNPMGMCGYLDDACTGASIAKSDIEAIIAALAQTAQPAQPPASKVAQWQPIETAPRDGADVLLFWGETRVGSFIPGREPVPYDPGSQWFVYGPGKPRRLTGPTHWMALPAAPSTEATATGEQPAQALPDVAEDGWCTWRGCGNDRAGYAHLDTCRRPDEASASEAERQVDMLMGMIGDISTALGISEEDQSCANGAEEILFAIEELKAAQAPSGAVDEAPHAKLGKVQVEMLQAAGRDGDVNVYVPQLRTAEALACKDLLKFQGHSAKFAATRFTITDAGRDWLARAARATPALRDGEAKP